MAEANFDKFRGIIAEQLGVDVEKVTPEASFTEDLQADSLDLVELIMACLLYTSPSPRDLSTSRLPSSA